jgi:hypothetical protein
LKNAMGHCIHIKPSRRFLFLKEKKNKLNEVCKCKSIPNRGSVEGNKHRQGGEDKNKNHKKKIEKLF